MTIKPFLVVYEESGAAPFAKFFANALQLHRSLVDYCKRMDKDCLTGEEPDSFSAMCPPLAKIEAIQGNESIELYSGYYVQIMTIDSCAESEDQLNLLEARIVIATTKKVKAAFEKSFEQY